MADCYFFTPERAWSQQGSKMADAGIGEAFETLPGRAQKRLHADGAGRQPGHQLGELIAPDLRTHQTRLAGRIHAVQREDILGQIDPEKHHHHGHLLAARSRGLSFCHPMVRAGQALRLLAESSVPGAVRGDGPFIR